MKLTNVSTEAEQKLDAWTDDFERRYYEAQADGRKELTWDGQTWQIGDDGSRWQIRDDRSPAQVARDENMVAWELGRR